MNIGITGTNGLLGSELLIKVRACGLKATVLDRCRFLISDGLKNAIEYIDSLGCDVVVHCAANTNLESCEINPQDCYSDNVILSELLANACRLLNVKFVFISSTGVYGSSKKTPYHEYDELLPTTVHHRSKMLAENAILSQSNDALIIRTGWLFGGDFNLQKNFVANRIREAVLSGGEIKSDGTQYGNPTYVKDVSDIIIKLVYDGWAGVFNCVNTGSTSRYGYVKEIINYAKIDVNVEAVHTPFPRLAKVSENESAVNLKLSRIGFKGIRPWEEGLDEYIRSSTEDIKKIFN
ncbi:dTDP-4-dehydrorhamnose reductase [Vibrio fortis]|uniref:dTDP-4-dehydrorhamnose reductase n=1 Tax=Vibrio fortis TaxID=212667 RepID=A0A066UNM0_9VIBR|nr:NAD(P)-dependent oxidoreductase [Vibrio fortis]KDN28655.1 dTDP-4-dehydrorhamnose reductase [Vibrio fortis]